MSWKKNAFSYLIWFLYTVLTGVGLMGVADSFCARVGIGFYWGAVFVFLYALLVWGFVFLLQRFARGHSSDMGRKREHLLVLEIMALLILLAVGILLRADGIEDVAQSSEYYEMAKVAAGQKIPQTVHGAVYFYVRMLHMVFGLLGNHFLAGIWFQIVLQLLAMMAFHFAVRRLAGAVAALIAFGFGMCAPYMVQRALVLSPEMLYFLFLAVAAAAVAALGGEKTVAEGGSAERNAAEESDARGKKSGRRKALRKAGKSSGGLSLPAFLIMGMIAALCFYIDIMGMLILFLALAMAFCRRKVEVGMGRRTAATTFCLLGAGLGFGACLLADAFLSGKPVFGVVQAWLRLYEPGGFRLPIVLEEVRSVGDPLFPTVASKGLSLGFPVEGALLLALLSFGVFSFWCDRQEERISVVVLPVLGISLASCYGIFTEEMPGFFVLYLLITVLAGLGLGQCFLVPYGIETEKVPEEEPGGDGETGEGGRASEPPDTETDGEIAGSKVRKEENPMGIQESAEESGKREVRYLENPMPLPKKHVKRVMDYAMTAEAEEDDFDFSVEEDDDFDI